MDLDMDNKKSRRFFSKNLRDNFYPYVTVGVAHRYICLAPSELPTNN